MLGSNVPRVIGVRLNWHSLRHTFGTRIVRETDIETARDSLGHADIATTAKYLHTDRKRK